MGQCVSNEYVKVTLRQAEDRTQDKQNNLTGSFNLNPRRGLHYSSAHSLSVDIDCIVAEPSSPVG